jgi:hypothetical protein
MSTEEDIELTEEEIAATRLALMVLCGLIEDLDDDDIASEEDFNGWQDSCKEQVGLDVDCDLAELLLSALQKFREETEYGDQEQEASQD